MISSKLVVAVKAVDFLWLRWTGVPFQYENEFGGVRDIDIPLRVVTNINVATMKPIVILLGHGCGLI